MTEFQNIPISELHESKVNPRHRLDSKGMQELTQSVLDKGVLVPLLVRRDGNGKDGYEILAGSRRFRAAKNAGLEELPVLIRELDDDAALELMIIDNLQREDVHPLDEAEGYRALIKAGYDINRIAQRVGRSSKYIYDRMKLTELTKEAKELFFDGRITAGHAILLARLKAVDQKRVIGARQRNAYDVKGGGLFVTDHSQLEFDGDEKKRDPLDELKPVSIRELQQWIDENVRFDLAKDDTQRLFPETAAVIAETKEQEEKIVPITRNYHVTPDAKDPKGARTYGPMSWKPATGKKESEEYGPAKVAKTCEKSVLGVFVVGQGRGETMRVCVDKACETHWGKRPKKKKASAADQSWKLRQEAQEKKWEAERKRLDEARKRWQKAALAIVKALAEKISTAKSIGQLAGIVFSVCRQARHGTPWKAIDPFAPKGVTAEAFLRRAAFFVLAASAYDEYQGPRELPKRAKAFGVDVGKILAAEASKPAPAKVQTSGKKKVKRKIA